MMDRYQWFFAAKFLLVLMITCSIRASPWKTANTFNVSFVDFSDSWPSKVEIDACKMSIHNCLDFSNYPSAYIEELIKKDIIKKHWFSKIDHEEEIMDTPPEKNGTLYDPLCKSYKQKLYPKGGLTREGEFAYIIQMQVADEYYHQEVDNTGCGSEKQLCHTTENDIDCIAKSNDFQYICKSKSCLQSNLIGIDRNKKIVNDVSVLTSCCCVCCYKKTNIVDICTTTTNKGN